MSSTTIRVPVLLHIEVDVANWTDAYGIEADEVAEDVAVIAASAVEDHLGSVVGGCRVGQQDSIWFVDADEKIGVEFDRQTGRISVATREARGDMWSPPTYVERPAWASKPDCLVAYPHDSILVGRTVVGDAFDW